MHRPLLSLAAALLLGLSPAVQAQIAAEPPAQTAPPAQMEPPAQIVTQHHLVPLPIPTLTPGELELVRLEGNFEKAVEKGGGKAFASWFADDGVTLSNGQPPIRGRDAIAAHATWDPKTYQLTWYAEGAQLGPSGDTGFTWGHYDARSQDPGGHPSTTSGRYITFWKKVNGTWKVALDASANDAPASAACCSTSHP